MKIERQTKDKENAKQRTVLTAKYVTQVAVMSGLITALKFALSFLPNVEVITVLIAVFSTVWGLKYSLPATLIFCTVEMAIYGIGSWVPLYFIYWPILAVVFHFALRGKRTPVAMGIALPIGLLFSVLFGVLSACADTLFVIGAVAPDMLDTYFVSYYLKGLWFDIVHTVCVVVSILVLYIPLVKISERIVAGINPTVKCEEDDLEAVAENLVKNDEKLVADQEEVSCQDEACKEMQDEKTESL